MGADQCEDGRLSNLHPIIIRPSLSDEQTGFCLGIMYRIPRKFPTHKGRAVTITYATFLVRLIVLGKKSVNRQAFDDLKQQIPLMAICRRMIGSRRGPFSRGPLMGLCPLHRDHHPSFLVDPNKDLFCRRLRHIRASGRLPALARGGQGDGAPWPTGPFRSPDNAALNQGPSLMCRDGG
jgi:hypothetical protein